MYWLTILVIMPVEYGEYDEEPTVDGTLVADSDDGAWLLVDDELDEEEVPISELDSRPGRLRLHSQVEEKIEYTDMVFDSFQMARLAFGLWEKCGPFDQPEGSAVPVEVATAGQAAVGGFLRLGNGYPKSRSGVAEMMGVTEQTVSNYCNRVRWTPE